MGAPKGKMGQRSCSHFLAWVLVICLGCGFGTFDLAAVVLIIRKKKKRNKVINLIDR